jgi:lipoprotein LprG
MTRRRVLALLSSLAGVPFLVACGTDANTGTGDTERTSGTPGTPASPPASATPTVAAEVDQLLAGAADRFESLESVHFALAVDGTTYVDTERTIQLLNAAGNVVRPDRVQATFQAMLEGTLTAEIRIITVGDETWMTDLVTGDWVPAYEEFVYNPAVLFDAEDGLASVMAQLQGAELLGEEDVEGQPSEHLRAAVASDVVDALTGGTMHSPEIGIEAWIARDTSELLRVIVREQPNPETTDPATWTLTLSRHNEPVTIEPPV